MWKARVQEQHEERVGQAWLTALLVKKGFHDPNNFPTLAKLLHPLTTQQTPGQMRATVETIASTFNLKVRKGKKKR